MKTYAVEGDAVVEVAEDALEDFAGTVAGLAAYQERMERHRAVWHGFDTETQDGRAILLTSESSSLAWPGSFGRSCAWLSKQGTRFFTYNMDYDARALMAFLPQRTLTELTLRSRATFEGMQLFYLPRKCFSVHGVFGNFTLYDVSQFFPGGLDDQAHEILRERKKKIPKRWLPRMAWALRRHRALVVEYGIRDAGLALRLGLYLADQFERLGISFAKPISAGSLFRQHFGSRMRFGVPRGDNELYSRTYRGGRIEVWKRGFYRGPVSLWDINSAYPAVLARLLDPKHCKLKRTKTMTPGVQVGAYKMSAYIPETDYLSPWAATDTKAGGLTVYPVGEVEGWVDQPTAELVSEYAKRVKLIDAWELVPTRREYLFPEVAKLYLERKKPGAPDLAIKLLVNSGYGKLAQAVGRYQRPKRIVRGGTYVWHNGQPLEAVTSEAAFTHYGLAATVTGQPRAWVYRAARSVPAKRLLFCATDSLGLIGMAPPKVAVGKGLGEWSCKVEGNAALLLGSGVYALREGRTWKVSVRGFEIVPWREFLRELWSGGVMS